MGVSLGLAAEAAEAREDEQSLINKRVYQEEADGGGRWKKDHSFCDVGSDDFTDEHSGENFLEGRLLPEEREKGLFVNKCLFP